MSDAFRSYLNDSIQCFLIKYNASTVEYYFPGFPGIGKKFRDKNTGQNDTGPRDRTPNSYTVEIVRVYDIITDYVFYIIENK